MSKFLLTSGCAASLLMMSIPAAADSYDIKMVTHEVSRITVNNNAKDKSVVKQLAPGVSISIVDGKKRITDLNCNEKNNLELLPVKNRVRASIPQGYVLFESFEDWDGQNKEWIPEGWTVDMKGNVDRDESWVPYEPGRYDSPVPDGKFGFKVTWGSDDQDEWLISPYVDVLEGMDLSYWVSLAPLWLFQVDSAHIDWNTGEWIGDPEVAATLQIWAQEEGSDWVMLKDYFDDYKDYTYKELNMINHEGTDIVSLRDYYGKKIRVAFRYVGYDGDEIFIDAVGIGYPVIEDVSYLRPAATQFWGLTDSPYMTALDIAIASYPVYEPLIWTNNNPQESITYTWSYADPETKEIVSAGDSPESLELIYHPDYTSETTIKNNFYSSPILKAEATHAVPVEYQAPFGYLQAGGKPEVSLSDGSEYEFTMLPFNLQELDLGMTEVNDSQIGDMSIPVFGYNGVNTDQYWLNYSLNGTPEIDGDFSHLIAIGNLYRPENNAPLVVRGGIVYGYGQISNEAELTMSIRAISAEDHDASYDVMEVVASKTISGGDIIRQDPSKSYMGIPFEFDEPVVLQTSDDVWAYMIMFEGFRSEYVSYFAPLQNKIEESDDYRCIGYIFNYIDLSRQVGRPPYHSTKTMRYSEDGAIKTFNGAFAIGLNAEYPWLTATDETVKLPADGSAIQVALGSYYDGSELTVEAPEGVNAAVAGRYDKCVLSLSLESGTTYVKGNVIVKGPGVEVSVPVDTASAVTEISTDRSDIKAVFDVAGRPIKAAKMNPGIYLVKFTDGTSRKIVVK